MAEHCRGGGSEALQTWWSTGRGVFWGPVGMDRMKLVASSSLPAESLQAPGASSTTKALLC